MTFIWWTVAYFVGMASQALISATLFPGGIDPQQQRLAAVLFVFLALVFTAVGVIFQRR